MIFWSWLLLVLWLLHFDVLFKPNSRKETYDLWSFWFHLLILFILIVICEPNQKKEILNENFG